MDAKLAQDVEVSSQQEPLRSEHGELGAAFIGLLVHYHFRHHLTVPEKVRTQFVEDLTEVATLYVGTEKLHEDDHLERS